MSDDTEHKPPVRQLRLVVEAADYDTAVRFYRDALGLTVAQSFEDESGARGLVLDAGRATLELHNPAQRQMVDDLETDGSPSGHIRVAFEVADAAGATRQLAEAGAAVIASPRVTPWQSLNSRLQAPAGLTVTLFQELDPAGEQAPGPMEAG
ncbi:MAG TPA: VOC family protein [Cryobacterium sp.]|nr:VOC family protein [Cryobacterium sp.]